MIFNIKIKTIEKITRFLSSSSVVEFVMKEDNLKDVITENSISISKMKIDQFKKDKNAELRLWKSGEPQLCILKKIDFDEKFNVDYFRNYLSGLIIALSKEGISNLYIKIPEFTNFKNYFHTEEYYLQSIVEGILLGNYNFEIYKSEKSKTKNLNIYFLTKKPNSIKKSIHTAEKIIGGVVFARNLTNEPANFLTPQEYAARVRKEFRNTLVKVQVFDDKELHKRKMNAILSVGKASSNKPRLIIVHYKPKQKAKKKIALVGKGVTYDTGGLSIKPTKGMLEMKADMAGSSTVFGVIKAAEQLRIPIEIYGIVPAVENAISGNAYKPGDIISTASGKTIEVKDTDAEGRIILADALEYASKLKPDEIIDFATLTGAVAVALGLFTAGLFTKNERLSKDLINSSKITYEHLWRLPFWDEYNKLLESKIADVSNLGPRWGGAITAGKFLEHFVDKNIPWAHIDLAGPALEHDLTNYTKDYCTGFGVRLVVRYLEDLK